MIVMDRNAIFKYDWLHYCEFQAVVDILQCQRLVLLILCLCHMVNAISPTLVKV